MNKLRILLSIIFICLCVGVANAQFPPFVKQNDGRQAENAQRVKRSISASYNKILANKGLNVAILQADKNEIEIITDGCSADDVLTEVKDGVLNIKMKKVTKGSAVQVNVSLKDLDAIETKRGASISTECVFAHKGTFTVTVDAKSEVELELDCENLVLESNSGVATLTGKVQNLKANLRGLVGDMSLNAEKLDAQDVDVNALNVNATVKFANSLKANVKCCTLNYIGDSSKVSATTSLGGKVLPVE